jgi:thymidylate synthase (FAD)
MDLEKKKIDVLDAGFVSYLDHMGSDITVVNAARVSFNKKSEFDFDTAEIVDFDSRAVIESRVNHRLNAKDTKLVRYLAEHDHWTPFAHPQISLHIKAPIFVRTQCFKHKIGFVENEISSRYVKDKPEFYTPFWRGAPTNGAKQGSSQPMRYMDHITESYQNICDDAVDMYLLLLEEGVAPEQARSVLPQSTYTEWHWTGSLSAYARFVKQRSDSHAQWEIQQYAQAVNSMMSNLFPESWKVLVEY